MNVSRLNRIIENMRAEGLAQIIVSAPSSVYYLTGRWIAPGERMLALLVKTDGTAVLYVNRMFALKGTIDVPLVEFDDTDDSVAILAEAIQPGELGVDKTWPSQFTIRLMQARPDVRPVLGSRPVDDARMCKDAEELALMREASKLNDKATDRLIGLLREGMTELEACALYTSIAKELGASGNSFQPLVCFGPNCAEPHHASDDTRLKKGDSVIIDVGLAWKSYCSDMTRTVFFGGVDDEQKKVYEIVRRANEVGRAAVRPGVPMKAFDRAARKVIEDAGYGEYFLHRTGHGIGLEVHEPPDNSATSEVIARPGMTFSVEPGVYLAGKFGVRVEDLVAITEDGCETLNDLTHELRVIEG